MLLLSDMFTFPPNLEVLADAWAKQQKLNEPNKRIALATLLGQKMVDESKGKFNFLIALLPNEYPAWNRKFLGFLLKLAPISSESIQKVLSYLYTTRVSNKVYTQLFEEFKQYALEGLRKDLSDLEKGEGFNNPVFKELYLDLQNGNPFLQVALFTNYALVNFESYNVHAGMLKEYLDNVAKLVIFGGTTIDADQLTTELIVEFGKYATYDVISFYDFLHAREALAQGKFFKELYINYGRPQSDQISATPYSERLKKWNETKHIWDYTRTNTAEQLIKINRYTNENPNGKKELAIAFGKNELPNLLLILQKVLEQNQSLLDQVLEYDPGWDHKAKYSWVHPPNIVAIRSLRKTIKKIRELIVWLREMNAGPKQPTEAHYLLVEALAVRTYHAVKGLYVLEEI